MNRTLWPVGVMAVLVPLGPIVDYPFLAFGRWIYATEVLLIALLVGWLLQLAGGGGAPPRRRAADGSPPDVPVLLLAGYAGIGLMALAAGQLGRLQEPVTSALSLLRPVRVLLLVGAVLFATRSVRQDAAAFARSAACAHNAAYAHSAACARSAAYAHSAACARILRLWTAATLLALGLITTYGILERIAGCDAGSEPGSFYQSSVSLAVHIAFFSPVALCLWLGDSGRLWRWAGAAAWVASMLCLPLTASRGALGSVLLTSILAVALVARGRRVPHRGRIVGILALATLGAFLLALHPEVAGERFAHKLQNTLAGDLFSSRTAAWRDAWAAIGAHPLTGEHPGAWAPALPLEMARRHGIPAALLALSAIASGAWKAGRYAWHRNAAADPCPDPCTDPDTESGATSYDGCGGERCNTSRNGYPGPNQERRLQPASVAWGVALGLTGLLLVGLAETSLGARTTPLATLTIALVGIIPVADASVEATPRPGPTPV